MSKRDVIFTSSPFAKADIHIGSLIPDRARPDQDAYTPIAPAASDISRNEDGAFSDSFRSQSSTAFKASLTKLFSASITRDPSLQIDIVAEADPPGLQSFVYTLKNPRELFKRLCKLDDVQKWLEEGNRAGDESWLVVEYRTLLNARVTVSKKKASGVGGKAAVPVAELAGGALPGDIADVKLEGKYESSIEKNTGFVAKDERVFAVACRRVKLGFFNKADVKLDKENCWKSALTRSKSGSQSDEMIEAELDDANDTHDEEVEARVSLGDEVFIQLVSE